MPEELHMEGIIFKYGPLQSHVAFKSGSFDRHIILIGGLGDGLLFAPYCLPLSKYLQDHQWTLVQTLLSSSHQGYGVSCLDRDAEEIHLLAKYLKEKFHSKGFVLMGHSTGCQDTVRYAQKYRDSLETPPALAFILQAPVSDREAQGKISESLVRERLNAAQLMVEKGQGKEILYRDWDMQGAPISSQRYVALIAVEGDDDKFSSDFSDEKLKEKLGHMAARPCLLMMGGADECTPEAVDKGELVRRMGEAIGPAARPVLIPGGKHNLRGLEAEAVAIVARFLESL